jgi:hypothetical protein
LFPSTQGKAVEGGIFGTFGSSLLGDQSPVNPVDGYGAAYLLVRIRVR